MVKGRVVLWPNGAKEGEIRRLDGKGRVYLFKKNELHTDLKPYHGEQDFLIDFNVAPRDYIDPIPSKSGGRDNQAPWAVNVRLRGKK